MPFPFGLTYALAIFDKGLGPENNHVGMNVKEYNGLFYSDDNCKSVRDVLSIEVGLSISINNVPFTVTMQTPGFEKDLVRGLIFSENIYRDLEVQPKLEVTGIDQEGFIASINVIVPEHLILKDFAGTRNVISASSCGLCGKTSFDGVEQLSIFNKEFLDPSLVGKMFDQMSEKQKSFQQSGGTHAAGIFALDGEMLSIREDIGRHNAVDKVIGDMIYQHKLHEAKCLTVSGRISFEIVSKARSAGIPYLASVSAPSSLAVDYAEESGISLMAFCRNHKLTVYSHIGQVRMMETDKNMSAVNVKENV